MVGEYVVVDGEEAQAVAQRQGAANREVLEGLYAGHSGAKAGYAGPPHPAPWRGITICAAPRPALGHRAQPVPGRPWSTGGLSRPYGASGDRPGGLAGLLRKTLRTKPSRCPGSCVTRDPRFRPAGDRRPLLRSNPAVRSCASGAIPSRTSNSRSPFPVTVADPLDEAQRPDRRFAAVIRESSPSNASRADLLRHEDQVRAGADRRRPVRRR